MDFSASARSLSLSVYNFFFFVATFVTFKAIFLKVCMRRGDDWTTGGGKGERSEGGRG